MTERRASGERAEQSFERIAAQFRGKPGVSAGTRFGSNPGLRMGGKIFAMLVRGSLVMKLPTERVDQLVAAGTAKHFDPGHGRLMKEWATIPERHTRTWGALASEAYRLATASPAVA